VNGLLEAMIVPAISMTYSRAHKLGTTKQGGGGR